MVEYYKHCADCASIKDHSHSWFCEELGKHCSKVNLKTECPYHDYIYNEEDYKDGYRIL